MLWRGRRQSDNIEDDRSGGGGLGDQGGGQFRIPIGGNAGGGGMSLSGLVIIGVVCLIGWGVFGINPLQLFGQLTGSGDIGAARGARRAVARHRRGAGRFQQFEEQRSRLVRGQR